eukprot:gnl/TRDRNA2_/TRDRNA2_137074_c0_seq2.p1 gnl/TRDRNA2_/TRDRNA2_137074_c0~~gnl/TRDRNA2_/TRDRNA2_137074_c0_seq2.p1  ORF type:complete len:248 (+),score=34.64 gnl/TRDRNA2_/TRDRNA2_137074_c0_seq2:97-840(+)
MPLLTSVALTAAATLNVHAAPVEARADNPAKHASLGWSHMAGSDMSHESRAQDSAALANGRHLSGYRQRRAGGNCRDQYPKCGQLGMALFLPGGGCKSPAVNMCMRTCGECWRVQAASSCQSPLETPHPVFRGPTVDWSAFFERMLKHQQDLRGAAHMISTGKPFLAEFPNFLSDAEADRLVAIAERIGLQPEDELPHKIRHVHKIDCDGLICVLDPLVQEVYRRVGALLDIPPRNFESLSNCFQDR